MITSVINFFGLEKIFDSLCVSTQRGFIPDDYRGSLFSSSSTEWSDLSPHMALNIRIIPASATTIPAARPTSVKTGPVLNRLSSQKPPPVPPAMLKATAQPTPISRPSSPMVLRFPDDWPIVAIRTHKKSGSRSEFRLWTLSHTVALNNEKSNIPSTPPALAELSKKVRM
jgi:hypothetical protein